MSDDNETQSAIMTETETALPGYWYTAIGEQLLIRDMRDDHLRAAMEVCFKNARTVPGNQHVGRTWREWGELLQREVRRRTRTTKKDKR